MCMTYYIIAISNPWYNIFASLTVDEFALGVFLLLVQQLFKVRLSNWILYHFPRMPRPNRTRAHLNTTKLMKQIVRRYRMSADTFVLSVSVGNHVTDPSRQAKQGCEVVPRLFTSTTALSFPPRSALQGTVR